MSNLDEGSYQEYQGCEPNDRIYAEDKNGNQYTGTVIETPGKTVYAQADDGSMLEFRGAKEDDTGDHAILLAFDGKDYEEQDPETGENKDGIEVTRETATLSFDTRIVEFRSGDQELVIG